LSGAGVEQDLLDGIESRGAVICNIAQFHALRIVHEYGDVTAARNY
jgi:hypothetical protein